MKRRLMLTLLLLASLPLVAQQAVLHRQRHFPQSVPAGNYSGITWLGGQRYAVVDDKSPTAGFHLMTIDVDSLTGRLLYVAADTFVTGGQPNRDEEGICYVPRSNTLYVSGEQDGEIIEYTLDGQLTGRRLAIPEVFRTAYSNRSFEALTYDSVRHRFWTCPECTLQADGRQPDIRHKVRNRLRLQSFGDDGQPREQYWYETERTVVKDRRQRGRNYNGVCALAALPDGRLVVMERDCYIAPRKIGSFVSVRLFEVRPADSRPGDTLPKRLLTEFKTRINLTARSFANYEGLCVGPPLADGRQLLVLVADSQGQYKGWLRDWFRTVVLP